MLNVPKHVRELQPYIPGKSIRDAAKEFGISKWVKLASNENPQGVSPKAMKAAQEALKDGFLYPHPRCPDLISALSKKFGKKEEEIVVGNGVDAILSYIIMAFTKEGDEVLTSKGTFIGTYVNVNKLGRSLKTIELKNYAYDLDGLVSAITPATKIIYVANPNNPTGTMFNKKQWETFFNKVPSEILIILDEAYFEYACDDPDYPNGLDYPLDRLIVTRTFSKAYGMADFRVGYGFSSASNIAEIQKVKMPFEPSTLAGKAAAAALSDEAFLESTKNLNKLGLEFFKREFKKLNLRFVKDTRANFYMLVFKNQTEAAKLTQDCLKKGLILRHLSAFGIPEAVRINTGTIEENKTAVQILKEAIS